MEVLKSGTPWAAEAECTGAGNGGQGCKAMLRALPADLRYYKGTDYPVFRPSAVTMRCPECGTLTDIPRDQWPRNPCCNLKSFTNAWAEGKVEEEE